MVPDTKLVPEVCILPPTRMSLSTLAYRLTNQAFRLLVCDACGITDSEYDIVVAQFLADIPNKDAQAVSDLVQALRWRHRTDP